jgi:hypothetical protein
MDGQITFTFALNYTDSSVNNAALTEFAKLKEWLDNSQLSSYCSVNQICHKESNTYRCPKALSEPNRVAPEGRLPTLIIGKYTNYLFRKLWMYTSKAIKMNSIITDLQDDVDFVALIELGKRMFIECDVDRQSPSDNVIVYI